MEGTESPVLSSKVEELRQALVTEYPSPRRVLGSQLGSAVRRYMAGLDLKPFGGLRGFVARYFAVEVRWCGKQGLDDVYDVSFSQEANEPAEWKTVEPSANAWLWSAVTDPSIPIQFAWALDDQSLRYAPPPLSLLPAMARVDKLTREDYRNIARNFIATQSLTEEDKRTYLEAIDQGTSTFGFTALIRERGQLTQWEVFRVNAAVETFAAHLRDAGAGAEAQGRWENLLRLAQQESLARRSHKNSTGKSPGSVEPRKQERVASQRGSDPGLRQVAAAAMQFLSDSDLENLNLPLGAVMRAMKGLRTRQ